MACPFCHWRSNAQGVDLVDESEEVLMMMATARERQAPEKAQLDLLISQFKEGFERSGGGHHLKAASSSSSSLSSSSSSSTRRRQKKEAWTVADINKKLEDAQLGQKSLLQGAKAADPANADMSHLTYDQVLHGPVIVDMISTLEQRLSVPACQTLDVRSLVPGRVPLRVKTTKRCRKDVENGKPGILVKPNVNPMNADSSRKVKGAAAAWWKKEESASHFLPRLTLVTLPDKQALLAGETCVLVVQITNYTLSPMNVGLDPSPGQHQGQLPPRWPEGTFHTCSWLGAPDSAPDAEGVVGQWHVHLEAHEEDFLGDAEVVLAKDKQNGTEEHKDDKEPVVLQISGYRAWIQLNLTLAHPATGDQSCSQLALPLNLKVRIGGEEKDINEDGKAGDEKDGVEHIVLPVVLLW